LQGHSLNGTIMVQMLREMGLFMECGIRTISFSLSREGYIPTGERDLCECVNDIFVSAAGVENTSICYHLRCGQYYIWYRKIFR
jgi:hypothetical protein